MAIPGCTLQLSKVGSTKPGWSPGDRWPPQRSTATSRGSPPRGGAPSRASFGQDRSDPPCDVWQRPGPRARQHPDGGTTLLAPLGKHGINAKLRLVAKGIAPNADCAKTKAHVRQSLLVPVVGHGARRLDGLLRAVSTRRTAGTHRTRRTAARSRRTNRLSDFSF